MSHSMKRLQQLGRLRRNAGVSIVTAIFLIVVLAGMGAAIVTVTTAQQATSALDVLGTRAYLAARAGVEYGLYQGLIPGGTGCLATTSFSPPAATLSGITVTLTCSAVNNVRLLTVTACNQPAAGVCPNAAPVGGEYVQRVISVSFE